MYTFTHLQRDTLVVTSVTRMLGKKNVLAKSIGNGGEWEETLA